MTKEKVLEDVATLMQDINNCTGDLVHGRKQGDIGLITMSRWKMESLMVQAHQELGFLYDYIKEGGNV